MIYYATTKRDRDRMSSAMLAFTGYQPSIFHEASAYRSGRAIGRRTMAWRVQDDSIGNDWGSRIKCYLDAGLPANKATQDRVAAHCNREDHE
jgi:hypothetical protein